VRKMLGRIWSQEEGVLTFEWILLITVLVIGIVGGLSAVRDAVITELGDVVEAVISLDQSYLVLDPWEIRVPNCDADGASGSSYQRMVTWCRIKIPSAIAIRLWNGLSEKL